MISSKKYKYVTVETTRHGKTLYYFRVGKGRRIPLPQTIGSVEFDVAYTAASEDNRQLHVRDMPKTPVELRRERTRKTLRGALRSCRTRARQKGVAFDLSFDEVWQAVEAQNFQCELTGIEFFALNSSTSRVDPYTPSIDRIVPSLGYVRGNVRVVIYAVNSMLLDCGEDLFHQIANSYRYWSRTKKDRQRPALFSSAPNHTNSATETMCYTA